MTTARPAPAAPDDGQIAWSVLASHSIKEYADTAVRLALLFPSVPAALSALPTSSLSRSLCRSACGCRLLASKPGENRVAGSEDDGGCPITSIDRVTDIEHGAAAAFEVLAVPPGKAPSPRHIYIGNL